MNKHTLTQDVNVPTGFRPVRFGSPCNGEYYKLPPNKEIHRWMPEKPPAGVYLIIEPIIPDGYVFVRYDVPEPEELVVGYPLLAVGNPTTEGVHRVIVKKKSPVDWRDLFQFLSSEVAAIGPDDDGDLRFYDGGGERILGGLISWDFLSTPITERIERPSNSFLEKDLVRELVKCAYGVVHFHDENNLVLEPNKSLAINTLKKILAKFHSEKGEDCYAK